MDPDRRCVVLGLGNLLLRDEGFGIALLHSLEARLGPLAGVEFIDGGVMGLDLLPLVEACRYLLVLDAVNAGQAPATLVELGRDELPLFSGIRLSQHQVGFQDVLGLASLRDQLPEFLHLVGIQPVEVEPGEGLSPLAAQRIPEAVDRAMIVLKSWGV
ncbi:MAG: hydrogenase maturation protease [Anaerolineaceae bacterium]|nr:hydrogenase maturation protease [Anaerolineaceae bacterium]